MSELSRRAFLKSSALLAAGAPLLGRAAADEPKPVKKVGANDRVRVAVIGYKGRDAKKAISGRGGSHIGGFLGLPDAEVAAICDVDANLHDDALKQIEERQKKRPYFVQDLRRILEDKSIDAVSIATPNHWHALAAIWAIQAGKDVYVEKPVSHNVVEGRRIVDFARRHNKIVQTGTQSRSSTGTQELMDFLHAGKIGRLTLVHALCYKPRGSIGPKTNTPVPEGVDYNLWCGPAPMGPITRKSFHYDWHWQWDYGNGDLGNQGIHEMDRARWGMGKATLCNAVTSLGGRFGYEDAGETANTQLCVYDYGDCPLIFEVRGLKTGDVKKAKVGVIYYGTEGYVVSYSYVHGAAFTHGGEKIKDFAGGSEGAHYANFLKAVKSRKHTDLTADIEEGHLSSALCHLGNISYRLGTVQRVTDPDRLALSPQGKELFAHLLSHLKDNNLNPAELDFHVGPQLRFDPRQERFVDNEKANALLTRKYREGFELPTL